MATVIDFPKTYESIACPECDNPELQMFLDDGIWQPYCAYCDLTLEIYFLEVPDAGS